VAEQAEKRAIIEMLERTSGNKTKTAELLDVDRKTLYNKMKSYAIEA
jgi:two-component system response regulator HydG